MQRYFTFIDNDYNLTKDDLFHIKNVMRMKVGDSFEIANDKGVELCVIEQLEPFKYKISSFIEENNELKSYIRLFFSSVRGEKNDLIIQKAVELGVKEIYLVNTSRSVSVMNKSNYDKKVERFNKIIKEASEQSKRSSLTKIDILFDYNDIFKYRSDYSFIAYEKDKNKDNLQFEDYFKSLNGKIINVLIGPEGGFSKEEVDLALKNDYISISLGKRILRSETAAIYTLSLLSFFSN